MSRVDFAHVVCFSISVSAWMAAVMCLISPHPVLWLKITLVCTAVISTCAGVVMCATSSSRTHSSCVTKSPNGADYDNSEIVNDATGSISGGQTVTASPRRRAMLGDRYQVVDEYESTDGGIIDTGCGIHTGSWQQQQYLEPPMPPYLSTSHASPPQISTGNVPMGDDAKATVC